MVMTKDLNGTEAPSGESGARLSRRHPQAISPRNRPDPVDGTYPLSGGRDTIGEGQRRKSAPTGAGTPCGRGLADRKDNDRLMVSIADPTDSSSTPPTYTPTCPRCGRLARLTSVVDHEPDIRVMHARCSKDHIFIVKWNDGAA